MSNLNCFSVVGRLTADAEVKHKGNSDMVLFSIANNTGYGQYACTNFIKCVAWGKQAVSLVQYLKKGKEIGISGVFENRRWTDQNGAQRDGWTLTVQGAINLMADPKVAGPQPMSQESFGNPGEVDY